MNDALLRVDDVIVQRNTGRRYVVIGWTARGKLNMSTPTGNTRACWWPYVSSPPKHYYVERDGVKIT